MTIRVYSRLSAVLVGAAALSLVASPAMARDWDGWRHHRHGDRIDGGDVLAGILILGGIAAIASAAGKTDKERRDRDSGPDWGRSREPGYGESRGNAGDYGSGRIGDAVDSCTAEVERSGPRVDAVDAVVREGQGWRIRGRIEDGRSFACSVGENGRIGSVTIDGRAAWPDEPAGGYDR